MPLAQLTEIVQIKKKDYGIFFTPNWVVDFMVELIEEHILKKNEIFILEPACGGAQFLIGIKRKNPFFFKRAKKIGVEINKEIIRHIEYLTSHIDLVHADYLLWDTKRRFDLIIGNPPYGIPSLSDHYSLKVDNATKQKYRNIYTTWYGKYNLYGAFIERSINLLKENGQLIFIVPATFMLLDEFKKLRSFLARHGKTQIIYLGPDVFKPEADVATVVLNFIKTKAVSHRLVLCEYTEGRVIQIKKENRWQGEVILFSTTFSKRLDDLCSYRLGDIYDIKISPRTPEIKHHPHVKRKKLSGYLPILNGRNLKCNHILYDSLLTGYWIAKEKIATLRNFFTKPHIVVGLGFRGNGRVGAAYDVRAYPWMGDVYHLLKKNSILTLNYDLKDKEVVDYLNTDVIKRYVKDIFREVTYHLSITQLKLLPLPTKKEWEVIKRDVIGEMIWRNTRIFKEHKYSN
jgi:adenine-specific DNA-methyltransferase